MQMSSLMARPTSRRPTCCCHLQGLKSRHAKELEEQRARSKQELDAAAQQAAQEKAALTARFKASTEAAAHQHEQEVRAMAFVIISICALAESDERLLASATGKGIHLCTVQLLCGPWSPMPAATPGSHEVYCNHPILCAC